MAMEMLALRSGFVASLSRLLQKRGGGDNRL